VSRGSGGSPGGGFVLELGNGVGVVFSKKHPKKWWKKPQKKKQENVG